MKIKQEKEKADFEVNEKDLIAELSGVKRVTDYESGSKAVLPINVKDKVAYRIKLDKGIITNLAKGEECCDALISSKSPEEDPAVAWILELKGTKNGSDVSRAIKQIIATLGYLNRDEYKEYQDYTKNKDYFFASIVGAADKRLPKAANKELIELGKILLSKSRKRKEITEATSLITYVQPMPNKEGVTIEGTAAPYTIKCSTKSGSEIIYPQTLIEIIYQ